MNYFHINILYSSQKTLSFRLLTLKCIKLHKRLCKNLLKKCDTELDRVNSTATIASRQAYDTDFISNAPNNMEKCIFIEKSEFNLYLH